MLLLADGGGRPWPGSRIVSSGRVKSLRADAERSVGWSCRRENRSGRCCRRKSRRRRTPPAALGLPRDRPTWPAVWPGMAPHLPARSPPPRRCRRRRRSRRPAGLTSGVPKPAERFSHGSVSLGASPAPMTSGQSGQRFFSAALPAMWSLWPCVFRMAAGRQAPAAPDSRMIFSGSRPGSITTQSLAALKLGNVAYSPRKGSRQIVGDAARSGGFTNWSPHKGRNWVRCSD